MQIDKKHHYYEKKELEARQDNTGAALVGLQLKRLEDEAAEWDSGGKYRRAADALTSTIVAALSGQSVKGIAATAAAPYVNVGIKKATTDESGKVNTVANIAAHALWGAVEANALGGSGTSGALAAGVAELSAPVAAKLSKIINEVSSDESLSSTTAKMKAIVDKIKTIDKGIDSSELSNKEKEILVGITSFIGQVVAQTTSKVRGADSDTASKNGEIGSIVAKNAVENNFLWSQYIKDQKWLSKEEQKVIDLIAMRSGAKSMEYYANLYEQVRKSNLPPEKKQKEIERIFQQAKIDSSKMEREAGKLAVGSKERQHLISAQGKLTNYIGLIPPFYEKSPVISGEQFDWMQVSVIPGKTTGFGRVWKEWDRQAGYDDAMSDVYLSASSYGGRGGSITSGKGLSSPKVSVLNKGNSSPKAISVHSGNKDYSKDVANLGVKNPKFNSELNNKVTQNERYVVAPKLIMDNKKYNYLFGNVKNDSHNTPRALQNKQQLSSIGIYNDKNGREIINKSLNETLSIRNSVKDTYSKNIDGKYHRFEAREGIITGPGGIRKFESHFEIMNDGSRRLTTIIFKGGN